MRLPGAAFLIAIGLLVLWAAINGKLDRLSDAWDYVSGGSDSLPTTTGAGTPVKPAVLNNLDSILNRDTYHVAAFHNALTTSPGMQDYPGGVL